MPNTYAGVNFSREDFNTEGPLADAIGGAADNFFRGANASADLYSKRQAQESARVQNEYARRKLEEDYAPGLDPQFWSRQAPAPMALADGTGMFDAPPPLPAGEAPSGPPPATTLPAPAGGSFNPPQFMEPALPPQGGGSPMQNAAASIPQLGQGQSASMRGPVSAFGGESAPYGQGPGLNTREGKKLTASLAVQKSQAAIDSRERIAAKNLAAKHGWKNTELFIKARQVNLNEQVFASHERLMNSAYYDPGSSVSAADSADAIFQGLNATFYNSVQAIPNMKNQLDKEALATGSDPNKVVEDWSREEMRMKQQELRDRVANGDSSAMNMLLSITAWLGKNDAAPEKEKKKEPTPKPAGTWEEQEKRLRNITPPPTPEEIAKFKAAWHKKHPGGK